MIPIVNLDNIEKKLENEFAHNYENKILNLDVLSDKLVEDNKYSGIRKYPEGSHHPKDFNYHDIHSCGSNIGTINKSNNFLKSLINNNIHCEKSDYTDGLNDEKIISSRKKACNCAYQRELTHKYNVKKGTNDPEHLHILNLAKNMCNKCYDLEQEIFGEKPKIQQPKVQQPKKEDDIIYYNNIPKIIEHMISIQNKKHLYKNEEGTDDVEKLIKYVYKNLDKINKNMKNIGFKNFRQYILVNYYIYYKYYLREKIIEKRGETRRILNQKRKIKNKKVIKSEMKEVYDQYISSLKRRKTKLKEKKKKITKRKKLLKKISSNKKK